MIDDAALDLYAADASAEIDWALEAELRRAGPDFAAVAQRAHEMDAERVDADQVAVASGVPLTLRGAEDSGAADAGPLMAAIAAARDEAEADVVARELESIPPLGTTQRQPFSRGVFAVALASAAAVAFVVWGGSQLAAQSRVEANERSQAEFVERDRGASEATTRLPVAPERRVRAEVAEPGPSPSPADVVELPAPKKAPEEPAPGQRRPSYAKGSHQLVDQIGELDAEAQRLWKAGDLEGAQRIFRQIIQLAPKGRYADLAFGDLFTLARQRGNAEAESRLWNEYLGRFPRGRFVEDARAGLCRERDEAGCWQAYLDDFPDGVHRRRAVRAVEKDGRP